jgi:hypothetical protein
MFSHLMYVITIMLSFTVVCEWIGQWEGGGAQVLGLVRNRGAVFETYMSKNIHKPRE